MNRFRSILVSLLVLAGCAGTYNQTLSFNPAEPLRIAVVPFVTLDNEGNVTQDEGRLLLDTFALVSTEQKETPAQIVRRQVLTELKKTGLDVLSPVLIDVDLPHHGFGKSDGTLDLEKLRSVPPSELCSKFLDCDAVMYGEVTKWDRTYLGVQTINTVGVHLKIVSARDGKPLFDANSEDSESRGLTKGPTGFSSIVLEPIRGLDSGIIVDLSRSVVQKSLAPLRLDTRPEFLEASPPVIFAASHDVAGGSLPKGHPLVVVAYASEHQRVSFSIGSVISPVPMFEKSPGHYYGEYIPLAADSFHDQPVTVAITDQIGRTTTITIPQPPITLASMTVAKAGS